MPNFYKELPENYKEIFHIDAKDKKTSVVLTIGSLVLMALAIVVLFLCGNLGSFNEILDERNPLVPYLVMLIGMIVYIVLHELVHGVAYKALTHQKLTFGLTLTVAFCGVPDIYTSRKTALIALAAPFTVFTVLLIPVLAVLSSISQQFYVAVAIIFAVHFGGCIGDLYMMYLLLFRFRDSRLLMKDTGPAQTLYMPE